MPFVNLLSHNHAQEHELMQDLWTEAMLGARLANTHFNYLTGMHCSGPQACLVYEHCAHPLPVIQKVFKGFLPHADIQSIIFQLLHALDYLHGLRISHQHVCPCSIILQADGLLKLASPEIGGLLSKTRGLRMPKTTDANRFYAAPEVLLQDSPSFPADIWAVGCLAGELITGGCAWAAQSTHHACFAWGQLQTVVGVEG